jgi:hypothetical protein
VDCARLFSSAVSRELPLVVSVKSRQQLQEQQDQQLVVASLVNEDYGTSESVGVAALPATTTATPKSKATGRFVVLKRNGTLQLWDAASKLVVNQLHLAEQVTFHSLFLFFFTIRSAHWWTFNGF